MMSALVDPNKSDIGSTMPGQNSDTGTAVVSPNSIAADSHSGAAPSMSFVLQRPEILSSNPGMTGKSAAQDKI
jgi:hypothetical protein